MIALLKKFVNSTIGTASPKAIDTMINEVKATNLIYYGSAVKSVQRGTVPQATSSTLANVSSINITISPVNSAKCMVLINGGFGTMAAVATVTQIYLGALSSTVLSITREGVSSGGNWISGAFGWQVIEYY